MITRRKHKQEMMIHGQRHVSAELLAPMVDLTAWYIRDLARRGKIPFEQVRSKKFFNPIDVERYLNAAIHHEAQTSTVKTGMDILNF